MKRSLLAAVLIPLLASCSGEGFHVAPCLDAEGKLAFELGTVRGWFGFRRTPDYSNVGIDAVATRSSLWWAHPNGHTRRFVRYGTQYKGWTNDTGPLPLVVGNTYFALFSGFNSGYATFKLGPNLPRCKLAPGA